MISVKSPSAFLVVSTALLCLLLASGPSDGFSIFSRHRPRGHQQVRGVSRRQEGVLNILQFLARLNPNYQRYVNDFLRRIGITLGRQAVLTTLSPDSSGSGVAMATSSPHTPTVSTHAPTTPGPAPTTATATAAVSTITAATSTATATVATTTGTFDTTTTTSLTTSLAPTTTEETEQEEMELTSTPFGVPQTTSRVTMTTVRAEENHSTSGQTTTTTVVMTTEEAEESESAGSLGQASSSTTPEPSEEEGTGVTSTATVTMTTEEAEELEPTASLFGQTSTTEEPEEEELTEIVLPLAQRFQCMQLEGVCLRQCETPADAIPFISCGSDVMGQPLVCCDD
ncbi:hypothetical protein BaRGS_00017857 [Batillaria attramentaria]|uniref:Uncharacterized protein n=1 Tax=Batillaria attramentaria TaxID=370345 RepID=A0ABD0KV05_9CAEN